MINNQIKTKIRYLVTRDSGANLKILKKLEKDGFIKIFDVFIENGRENKKVKEKILPVIVLGHSRWDEAVFADKDCAYDSIRKVIGVENIKDAMHLEAHIRKGNDYFITEDGDFLNNRESLKNKFGGKILTPIELQSLCQII